MTKKIEKKGVGSNQIIVLVWTLVCQYEGDMMERVVYSEGRRLEVFAFLAFLTLLGLLLGLGCAFLLAVYYQSGP